jgi:hypothetical protein
MPAGDNGRIRKIIGFTPIFFLFVLGMWLVILQPMGVNFILVPGDLGDARLNNYILEHFYHWITGVTKDYWNAPFFYPFQGTIAFSDNLLGSAPFYALLRWIGIDMISAFQGWYIFGSLLNFATAGYVLLRMKFNPLAVGMGAFIFAFSLPVTAQENHVQLVYHFCIPLACFYLWQFHEKPRLHYLVLLIVFVVWQFYLTIYMGIFLVLLLVILIILFPFVVEGKAYKKWFLFWPQRVKKAWSSAGITKRLLTSVIIVGLILVMVALIFPYYRISRLYNFSRNWSEVYQMLPRLKSFLLADNSLLWKHLSSLTSNIPHRVEHQLFPGLAVILLALVGIIYIFRIKNNRLAWLHLGAAAVLIGLTINIKGITLYHLIWSLPGLNSVRAITRIILVILWPLSVFTAWTVNRIQQDFGFQHQWISSATNGAALLLVLESALYLHTTYNKIDAQARLVSISQQLPANIPANPILFVARDQDEPFWSKEIDAMLLSQQLNWPTLNGYSGNFPPGYSAADSCAALITRIQNYLSFAGISDPAFFDGIIQRVIPIGFQDCDPAWWGNTPP